MNTDNNILPVHSFAQTLFNDEFKELSVDFGEMALDQLIALFLEDAALGVLKDIPLIQSLLTIRRTALGIREYFNLKKQLAFIQALQRGNPDPGGVQQRREAARLGKKWFRDEVETTLLYLDRQNKVEKAIIMAELYKDLLNNTITFLEYQDYLCVLELLFLSDIVQLIELLEAEKKREQPISEPEAVTEELYMGRVIVTRTDYIRCNRLLSLGLLYSAQQIHDNANGPYSLTRPGRYLAELFCKKRITKNSEEKET